jgi:hypothetical protein
MKTDESLDRYSPPSWFDRLSISSCIALSIIDRLSYIVRGQKILALVSECTCIVEEYTG